MERGFEALGPGELDHYLATTPHPVERVRPPWSSTRSGGKPAGLVSGSASGRGHGLPSRFGLRPSLQEAGGLVAAGPVPAAGPIAEVLDHGLQGVALVGELVAHPHPVALLDLALDQAGVLELLEAQERSRSDIPGTDSLSSAKCKGPSVSA